MESTPTSPLRFPPSETMNRPPRADRFIPLQVRKTHYLMYEEIVKYRNTRNIERNENTQILPRKMIENILLGHSAHKRNAKPTSILKMRESSVRKDSSGWSHPRGKLYSFNTKPVCDLSTTESTMNTNGRILDFSRTNFLYLAKENVVYGFDYTHNKTHSCFAGQKNVYSVALNHSDDNLLGLTTVGGSCQVVDLLNKMVVRSFPCGQSADKVLALDWSLNLMVQGTANGSVRLKDLRAKGEEGQSYAVHKHRVSRVRANQVESCYLVSADIDGGISLTDSRKGVVRSWADHFKSVRDLAWSPLNSSFFSSCGKYDGKVLTWNINGSGPTKQANLGMSLYNLDYSSDGNIVVSCGRPDNSVLVLDGRELDKIASFEGHESSVYHLTMNSERSLAVSCSQDGAIKFWDLRNHLETTKRRSKSSMIESIR